MNLRKFFLYSLIISVVVSEAETKSIDAEIARLKVRLEELERRKAGHA